MTFEIKIDSKWIGELKHTNDNYIYNDNNCKRNSKRKIYSNNNSNRNIAVAIAITIAILIVIATTKTITITILYHIV